MNPNQKLKICMVVHKYYYSDARVMSYAKALYNQGAQVDVLCVLGQISLPIKKGDGVRVFTIPIRHKRGNPIRYLFEYGMSFLLFSLWLLILYFRNHYDVIHVHSLPDLLIVTALIPKLFGSKLILDVHDPMPELFMAKYHKPANHILVKLLSIEERLSAKLANAIITVNMDCKENLATRGTPADKIVIVRNFPDPAIFKREKYKKEFALKHSQFTLIYPGTIAQRYSLDVAISALPQLHEKIPQIQLVIIGEWTDYATELLSLAERLGVSQFVKIKSPIPRDQVPLEIAHADIGIYTARSSPHMDIAIPGKILEYALMGIPVIASRLRVLENLFTESSILFFEPGNDSEFACYVLELFENPARREELVQNMDRTFVRTQNWENEKREYFNVLRRLLPQGLIPQGDDQCP